MLKELILRHGKEKVNTLTKYPSVLTLHRFGQRGRLTDVLTTDITGEKMFASEKIDGTNVRIVCWQDEFLIGSRNFLLHYSKDLFWDEAGGIVRQIFDLKIPVLQPDRMTVVYGELFGGKITGGSKNYGKEKHGFRVFDVAVFDDLSILDGSTDEISAWRESSLDSSVDNTLRYGQNFVNPDELQNFGYDLVPEVAFDLPDFRHETVMAALQKYLPETNVALSDSAQKIPEGVILRNFDRTKIVKLRLEDYARTLRKR